VSVYSKISWGYFRVAVMSRWPLYEGDSYCRFYCIYWFCVHDFPRL